jgi:hypothetical protein
MKLNSILTPPTLTVSLVHGDREFAQKAMDTTEAILSGEKISKNESIISVSIENQLERMVSNCACKVWVPSSIPPAWGTPNSLRSNLPPSYHNILGFADRSDSLWITIENYLRPVFSEIPQDKDNRFLQHLLLEIFWAMYLLTISARQHSEVFINPEKIISIIDKLNSGLEMSSESRARIMRIRGIFSLYTLKADVQGFHCITTSGATFRERLDEILEDAYLLEASNLRVFFGYKSNLASLWNLD